MTQTATLRFKSERPSKPFADEDKDDCVESGPPPVRSESLPARLPFLAFEGPKWDEWPVRRNRPADASPNYQRRLTRSVSS